MNPSSAPRSDTAAGAAVYSKNALRLYDFWVHGVSNRWFWECSTERLHAHYARYTSANHLEVGAGTGFFLKQVRFPVLRPRLVFMDLNPNTLEVASAAMAAVQPAGVIADILSDRMPSLPGFDSIAFNYVWHCLPGPPARKQQAFANLAGLLNPGGVLFGSTLLGRGVPQNLLARGVMALYNRRGIFGNREDSPAALEAALAASFSRYEIHQDGMAALFTAWK